MFPLSTSCRYFLCLLPYLILVSNKDIIYHITGPITIPPFNKNTGSLIYWIAAMQFVRIFYEPVILRIFRLFFPKQHSLLIKDSLMRKMSVKYGIVIIMKMVLIFSEIHRMKYYLHVFFLELFIMALNVVADLINNYKVSSAMDIIAIDGLNRVAIFYELTRTFNPNFGLYFFGNNLLSLICYQLQGKRTQVLYVKHDIYRLMVVTVGYLCLFSLLQCSISYRPLIIFMVTFYFFFQSIRQFSSAPIQTATNQILIEQDRLTLLERILKKNIQANKLGQYSSLSQIKSQKRSLLAVLKDYLARTVENKAFLNFLALIALTISIQVLFVYNSEEYSNDLMLTKCSQNSFISYLKQKNYLLSEQII